MGSWQSVWGTGFPSSTRGMTPAQADDRDPMPKPAYLASFVLSRLGVLV
jgi:hypothetical protein